MTSAARSAFTSGAICRYCPLPMNILINVILAIDMLVAVLMTLVILMQRPKSEGLGAAFGGGVTENIFGAQTTNVLTKFTGWLAGIFFVLTFALGILYARRSASDSSLHRELMGMPAATPAASVAPATGSPGSTPARARPRVPRTFRLLQPHNLLLPQPMPPRRHALLFPLPRSRTRQRNHRPNQASTVQPDCSEPGSLVSATQLERPPL